MRIGYNLLGARRERSTGRGVPKLRVARVVAVFRRGSHVVMRIEICVPGACTEYVRLEEK